MKREPKNERGGRFPSSPSHPLPAYSRPIKAHNPASLQWSRLSMLPFAETFRGRISGFCHIFHFKLRIKMFQRFRSPPKNSFVCRRKENWTRTLRRFALTRSQRPKRELFNLFMVVNCMNQSMELTKLLICHFTNEKRTGVEMYPAIVSGIVTGEAPVNCP